MEKVRCSALSPAAACGVLRPAWPHLRTAHTGAATCRLARWRVVHRRHYVRLHPATRPRRCALRQLIGTALTPPAAVCPSAAVLRRSGMAQNGDTPLHYAAQRGHVECVALLVERGADKEAKDKVRCAGPLLTAACCMHRDQRLLGAVLCRNGAHARARSEHEGAAAPRWRSSARAIPPLVSQLSVTHTSAAGGGRVSVPHAPLLPCAHDRCRAALTPPPLLPPPLRCAAVDVRRVATRRCIGPRPRATLTALRCWWSAAPTKRQRTRCVALHPLPPTAAACCVWHGHFCAPRALVLPRARNEGGKGAWRHNLSCLCPSAPSNSPAPMCVVPVDCCVLRLRRRRFSLRCCAAPLWMRAGWQHAAAPRRVQWPRRVRCAAGGARRRQGSKGPGALCCALTTLLRAASARPRVRSAALCRAHSRRHLRRARR
jgi:hypothetical protein